MTAGEGNNPESKPGELPPLDIDEAYVEKPAGHDDHEAVPPGAPAVTLPVREPRLRQPPFAAVSLFIVLIIASWIPLVVFARARAIVSPEPRIQLMQDMALQPRYGPQHWSDVFLDSRADRSPVPGTVARGEADLDDFMYRGFSADFDTARGKTKITFFDGFPKQIKLDEKFLKRGQGRFDIYCAPCHGLGGRGDGMVNQRAQEDQQAAWTQPADFAQNPQFRVRPTGHIFNTITNGIRHMPAYGKQIPDVMDRWAIVAYVRALQYSQSASPSRIPAGVTPKPPPPATQPASQPVPGATPPGVTPPVPPPVR